MGVDCGRQRPGFVTVYGSAGIGKSRLHAEFTARLGRAEPGARVLFGRCRPYGESVAFGAFGEVLRSLVASEPGGAESTAGAVHDLVVSLSEASEAAPELAAEAMLYGAGLGPAIAEFADLPARRVRAAIRDAWQWLLGALASETPLVVVIEDLHWADPALLDLLEHLVDAVAGPVLFIGPARPMLADRRPGWGSGRAAFSEIRLEPLTGDQGLGLVSWYVGEEVARSLGSRIVDRAEGNPYFLEEIVRGLIDDGSLVRTDGGWTVAGDVAEIQIPATVQAVISSRIDLLRPDEKRMLQCASVVGRTFWTGALAHLGRSEPAAAEAVLGGLEARELVLAGTDSAVSGEREYRFKHALVRQVAYGSLARRDRSLLHRAVADWLAGPDGTRDEMIEVQAHHLALAYDALYDGSGRDPDAEDLRVRAHGALIEASGRARRRVALGQARYFARQARRLAETDVEASQAAEALGEAYFYGYDGDPAWRALREAIELRLDAASGPDPQVARLCARALQMPMRWPGAMQEVPDEVTVLRYLHLGMDHAPARSEEAVRLLTLQGFWQHAFPRRDGDRDYLVSPEESLRSAEQAVADAAAMGRPDLESAALDAVTAYYIPRGLFSAARPSTRRRLELIGALHDLWEIGDTYAMQGWIGYHLGDYRDAFEQCSTGFERTVSEAPSLALHCLRWRCLSRFRLGDWDGVRRDLAIGRGLLGEQREEPPDFVSQMFAAAALVHEYRGEHTAADSILDVLGAQYERRGAEDRDTSRLSQWAEFVAPLLARRGRFGDARRLIDRTVWRRRGRYGLLLEAAMEVAGEAKDWERAADLVAEGRAVAAESGSASLVIAADYLEGRAAQGVGDLGRAIDVLGEAVAAFDRIDAAWDAARAGLALAGALDDAGFHDRVGPVLGRCRPVFERLGARREIDRCRDLVSRS